jgi:hypothetical protein
VLGWSGAEKQTGRSHENNFSSESGDRPTSVSSEWLLVKVSIIARSSLPVAIGIGNFLEATARLIEQRVESVSILGTDTFSFLFFLFKGRDDLTNTFGKEEVVSATQNPYN